MWLEQVNKNQVKKDQQVSGKRLLENEQALIIKALYKTDEVADDYEKKIVETTLRTIKFKDCWIKCSCNAVEPAYLIIVEKESSVHLRNHKFYYHHVNDCILGRNRSVKKISTSIRAKHSPSKAFIEVRKIKIGSATQSTYTASGKKRGSSNKGLTALGNKLFTLLDAAKLNRWDENLLDFDNQVRSLQKAAKAFTLIEHLTLDEYLWIDKYTIYDAKDKLNQKIPAWPDSKSVPQGFIIKLANAFVNEAYKDDIVYCYKFDKDKDKDKNKDSKSIGKPVYVVGVAKKSSGYIGSNSGPFLVIFNCAKLAESDYCTVTKAFLVPVYKDQYWFPVESGFERQVLTKLINLRMYLKKSHQLNIIIEKPLFDLLTHTATGEEIYCRPDFILKHEESGKQYIVEVMGIFRADYLLRKERMIAVMKNIAPVFKFEMYTSKNDQETKYRKLSEEEMEKKLKAKTQELRNILINYFN